MPLNKSLKKVMVIGSGPIVIGQAAEFDYAGTASTFFHWQPLRSIHMGMTRAPASS